MFWQEPQQCPSSNLIILDKVFDGSLVADIKIYETSDFEQKFDDLIDKFVDNIMEGVEKGTTKEEIYFSESLVKVFENKDFTSVIFADVKNVLFKNCKFSDLTFDASNLDNVKFEGDSLLKLSIFCERNTDDEIYKENLELFKNYM